MRQGRKPAKQEQEQEYTRQQQMAGRDAQMANDAPLADPRMPEPRRRPDQMGMWSASDEQAVNPPWEQESGRIPTPRAGRYGGGNSTPEPWDWNGDLTQDVPGIGLPEAGFGDLTGTGRIPAIVPLAPGESSWGKGIRAPKTGGPVVGAGAGGAGAVAPADGREIEVDEQPSAQMRALSAGNLARATVIVTGALLLSRVLGLLRTAFFAYVFGASTDSSAFTNAFVVPDTIFNIVAGGALASAFIPVFADYLIDRRDRNAAWHIASSALNISILVLTILAVLGILFADPLIRLTQPTLFSCTSGAPCEGPIVVSLTRVMLLQPIFLGGATVAISILQARQRFVLPAIGQVIYTASLIGGIAASLLDVKYGLFGGHLTDHVTTLVQGQPVTQAVPSIYGPTWGVVAGAVLQFAIQIPGLAQAKMPYRLSFDFLHPGVREMFRLMAPRLLNAVFLYLSVFINRNLLNIVDPSGNNGVVYGYVTAFTLVMVPVGVFGMAVSQAAFPTLAALVSVGNWDRLRETIMRTVRGITYLAIPSTIGLIVLAQPLSSLLLAHGNFDPSKLPVVSGPLIYFSVGLMGLALVEILTRAFYALHDSRTPVEVSILQFMFVIGLSVVLLDPMGANGLALATSLGSLGEAAVLILLLRPRLLGLNLRSYAIFFLNVLAASVVMGLAALFVYTLGTVVLPVQTTSVRETVNMTIRVIAAIVAAVVVYFGFSKFLGIDDVVPLDRLAKRALRIRR